MSLRVLFVPDKFKATLTAQAAAQAMARGWGRAQPHDLHERLPITDGRDGFGAVLSSLFDSRPRRCLNLLNA